MKIGVVGGGKAALAIMRNFYGLKDYQINIICDIKENSPGIMFAKENGIRTTKDLQELLGDKNLELLIELTGSEKILTTLRQQASGRQKVMSGNMAHILYDIIDANEQKSRKRTGGFLEGVEDISKNIQEALTPIGESEKGILKLLREANLINVNAAIEAARAGEQGKAFAVVVEKLNDLIENVKDSLMLITEASKNINNSIETLNNMKNNLAVELS